MSYNRLDPLQKGKNDKIVRINCIYPPKLARADKALQNYDTVANKMQFSTNQIKPDHVTSIQNNVGL